MDVKDTIERVSRYEKMMQEAEEYLSAPEKHFRKLGKKIRALKAYYGSDEWKQDFAADEAGLLPKDLKRGVLSEDGIDDLIARYEELEAQRKPEESREMDKADVIRAGIFGVVVGDALGVPVEFTSRWERQRDPVTDMREYGTHSQPKGTWSDDSSMMLANMDSMIICDGIDYADIMKRFRSWNINGEYTPFGTVFDIGITCARAISHFRPGVDPLQCGLSGERDNGNGSLMRIMPVSIYSAMKEDFWEEGALKKSAEYSHNASRLTHAHPRSQMGCMIYTAICHELIFRGERTVKEAVSSALTNIRAFYAKGIGACGEADFQKEIASDPYGRMWDVDTFGALPEEEIKSSGYVVHTLEAAVWCLLNTSTFAECTLKAVNLGDDTDTVGAVAGGLAGLAYGYSGIPKEWLDVIEKRAWIDGLCNKFVNLTAFD